MKKLLSVFIIFIICFPLFVQAAENTTVFSDVDNNFWGYQYIKILYENNIIKGYEDGTFKPDNNITRAEFAVILTMAAKPELPLAGKSSFADVKPEAWYSPYAEAVKDILPYTTENNLSYFKPDVNLTREDTVVGIVNQKGYELENTDEESIPFSDFELISETARRHVLTGIARYNLFKGYYDGSFRPEGEITRAELATVICRAYFPEITIEYIPDDMINEPKSEIKINDIKPWEPFYALILKTNITDDFLKEYQIQLLTSEGILHTLNLAEKSNINDSVFSEKFPKGSIARFELNEEYELVTIALAVPNKQNNEDIEKLYPDSNLKGIAVENLKFDSKYNKIDSYFINDDTKIFFSFGEQAEVSKNNSMSVNISALSEWDAYSGSVIYNNESKKAEAVILFDTSGCVIRHDHFPLVITEKATVKIDGYTRVKYTGYINKEETKITVAESCESYMSDFNANDVILIAVNGDNELVAAAPIAKFDKGYYVTTNFNNKDITQYNDSVSYDATTYFLSLNDKNEPISDTKKALFASSMNGFAYTGKAYSLINRKLKIITGTDAGKITKASDGSKIYGNNKSLINEFSIHIDYNVYFYNAKTNKITVGDLKNLETEVNTNDHTTGGNENDDLVYVYCYDGYSWFILVVDVDGDNVY